MISDYYESGFEIKRVAITNSNGIMTESYSTFSTISGKLRPLNANEIYQNDKRNMITTHRFYCDVQTIQNTDKIYNSNTGKTYNVIAVKNPFTKNNHLEIDLELIED